MTKRTIAVLALLSVAGPAWAAPCQTNGTDFLTSGNCTTLTYAPKARLNGTAACTTPTACLYATEVNTITNSLENAVRPDLAAKASQIAAQSSQITSLQSTIATLQGQIANLYTSAAPTCSSFTPTSGAVGTSVTVTGTNLIAANGLTIGGAASAPVPSSNTSLVAIVPAQAATGSIVVYAPGGSVTCSGTFTVSGTTGSITSVTVNNASVAANGTVQMTANVSSSGTINTAVTWSLVSGAGSITSGGMFTAGPTSGAATVRATSVADGTKSGTGTVTITAATGSVYYVSHGGSDGASGSLAAPWRTLAYAVQRLSPGDTLYLRGGPSGSDDNTACSSDGAKNGACWTENSGVGNARYHSPLAFAEGANAAKAGTAGSPVTYACYPGEVCIIEPASRTSLGAGVVYGDPGTGANNARCSYITFKDLIFDARNGGYNAAIGSVDIGASVRFDYGTSSTDDTTFCHDIQFQGTCATATNGLPTAPCTSKIRHGKNVGGVQMHGKYVTFNGVEVYENGAHVGQDITNTCSDGEHDHAFYVLGTHFTITNSYIHDNIQAIQVWNPALTGTGQHVITGNWFHNNQADPWATTTWGSPNGAQCQAGHQYGSIAVYDSVGSGTSGTPTLIQGNQIDGINEIGIAIGGAWAGNYASYVTANNNWIYNNGSYSMVTSYGGTGNVTTPNTNNAKP